MQILSGVPWGCELLYVAQRSVTRSLPSSDETFRDIFSRARSHLEAIEKHRAKTIGESRFYEFGAGWELGIPLSLFALGVKSQVVVDIRRLLRIELVNEVVSKLERMNGGLQVSRMPDRGLSTGHSNGWITLLQQRYGIRYIAPCDARKTGLDQASVDVVTSTNTLEHIPPDDIRSIFVECHRLLGKDGLMSFIIDYQDHYSYVDKRISAYNFLKFSEGAWRWCNSPLHYQNRLRHKDYLRLLEETGFEIIETSLTPPSEGDVAHLNHAKLWGPFREKYELSELAIRSAHIVARSTRRNPDF